MISLLESNQAKRRFVIHEHKADKAGLHYDIRLEKNGILKSWACKKLPRLVSGELKRVYMSPTTDHGINWLNFKGTIEDGYGKGQVNIWDSGKYTELRWETNDRITISFHGAKIKGEYAIIPYKEGALLVKKVQKKSKK